MEDKRGKNMNEKNTEALLDLINKLITLVGTNVDNINKLANEIADLKRGNKNESRNTN